MLMEQSEAERIPPREIVITNYSVVTLTDLVRRWFGLMESNHHWRFQKPVSCHWTKPEY